MKALWIRVVAYLVLAVALAQLNMLEARHFSADVRFSEFGYVEYAQSVILAANAIALVFVAWRRPGPEPMLYCMALGFAILLVRENDQVLELWLPHGAWKWPALALLLWLTTVFLRNRAVVMRQLRTLIGTQGLGVLIAGFTTLAFSRLFGHGKFWEAVMEDRYWRPVKNAAQEGLELFAMGLITAGVVELLLQRRGRDA